MADDGGIMRVDNGHFHVRCRADRELDVPFTRGGIEGHGGRLGKRKRGHGDRYPTADQQKGKTTFHNSPSIYGDLSNIDCKHYAGAYLPFPFKKGIIPLNGCV
jgi:hypothetical protein